MLELSQTDNPEDNSNGRVRYYYPNAKNPTHILGVDGAKVTTVIEIDPKVIRVRAETRREKEWLKRHGQKNLATGFGNDADRGFRLRRAELDEQLKTELAVSEEEWPWQDKKSRPRRP